MAKQLILGTLFTAICLFTGCAQKQVKHQPLCPANMDMESAMKQSELALLKMNFVIDKADPTIGYMRTKPLPGGQFFEFWRKDNTDAYLWAMSNIDSIQRIAELNFTQANNHLCIDCNVTIERLSIPEKEIDSSARVYTIFSSSSERRQTMELEEKQREQMQWIDIGPDSGLEARILKRINQRIQKINKGKK